MSSTSNTSTHHTSTIGSIGTPSRRNTELALLVFAVAIPVFAYANVGLAINDSVPPGLLSYGLGLGLLAGVGHIVVRKFAPYADPLLLPLATLLNGIGLVVIWRLDQSKRLQAASTFVEAAPANCCTPRWAWPSSWSCWSSSRTTASCSATPTSPWSAR